jgi:hypothetical protein
MQEEGITSIVKADRLGRTHYSAEYKAEVLRAFEASSLSGAAFSKQCGIKYPTFASWVTKRKRARAPQNQGKDHPAPAFVVAELSRGVPTSHLEVYLPGGAVAKITEPADIDLLAALIKALA